MGLGNMSAHMTSSLSHGFLSRIECAILSQCMFSKLFTEMPQVIFWEDSLLSLPLNGTVLIPVTIFMSLSHCLVPKMASCTWLSRNGMPLTLISKLWNQKNCLDGNFMNTSVSHTNVQTPGQASTGYGPITAYTADFYDFLYF